ncbi:MAG: N-6 DNA methylase [Planctomycetia bacterium]|nr:N-6 DNA methylase [Planctomycetia bacterium]
MAKGYMVPATKRKLTGAHFTPPELGTFVAERLCRLMKDLDGPLRVLDPACGDGNLLRAMVEVLPDALLRRITLVGIENDDSSFDALRSRGADFGRCRTDFINGDFLDFFNDDGLFEKTQSIEPVDVIVANPPYVRTQVMGARRAQALAARFGLSGRVDLYQAFLVAMARQLRPGGILGVITSNRFLTTKGGMATRRFLRLNFEILELVDLGDTKLFEAAVLPALVFARKRAAFSRVHVRREPGFIRIYEARDDKSTNAKTADSVLDCLQPPRSGLYRSNGTTYQVTAGRIPIPGDDARPWTMLTGPEGEWVSRIQASAECRIGDIAKVRVGIKSTADKVFIRDDWHLLPPDRCPEKRHLYPLLSQQDAAKWRSADSCKRRNRVLYTHEVVRGQRKAIEFDPSSPTWKYLLENRARLQSRKYVIDAGRAWYELWVPQDPTAWSLPKVVFPDISPEPRFFLDKSGSIVDGNCYWITTNDPDDEDLLYLILGVANSALMMRYHDLAFQNKLYSQRRRHLTQYVTDYPIPDRNTTASRRIIQLARRLSSDDLPPAKRSQLASEVDELSFVAFGIEERCLTGTAD